MKVLGLMSGTSMDGLDCCYADIYLNQDNNIKFEIIKHQTIPFDINIRDHIANVIGSNDNELISICDRKLGIIFSKIVQKFIGKNIIELIAMHGQTISHINKVKTSQIGNPEYLFKHYKVPVIYDFRSQDIMLGGNGAPLVPYLDWLLSKKIDKSILTVNIGGIANVTYVPSNSKRDRVIGFDRGPGMCLIDQYVQKHWNINFDSNGDIAKKGKINSILLNQLLNHPFIEKRFPKSTSREEFDINYLENIEKKYVLINKYDILRTLVYFTANSIYINTKLLTNNKESFILMLSGGGANNSLLVEDIKKIFNIETIYTSDYYGIHIDNKEAFLMAVMGLSKYQKIYNNMPSVTGANKYASYGTIYE